MRERAACHVASMENAWTNSQWDLALYDLACRTPRLTLHMNTSCDEVLLASPDGNTDDASLIAGSSLDPDEQRVSDQADIYTGRP